MTPKPPEGSTATEAACWILFLVVVLLVAFRVLDRRDRGMNDR